jgi:signal transduction histidine kinase
LAHAVAGQSVLLQGRRIAAHLAEHPVLRRETPDAGEWDDFARRVSSLHQLEDGLQYVSVTTNGITIFQRQTTTLDPGDPSSVSPPVDLREKPVGRAVLTGADAAVPVFVFPVELTGADGTVRTMEVGLRRETVGREEKNIAAAIASMFQLSLAIILTAFGVCIITILIMMRREAVRERQLREQEHLVFSGVLANGIVHDFRNPMSSMKLDLQMLQREAGKGGTANPERFEQLSTRLQATMERMDKVFQEFFHLSRVPGAGRESLDLSACLRECMDLLAPDFEQAGVACQLDAPDTGLRVHADPASLRRTFVNLLANARQFSVAGDTVTIRLSATGTKACIDVLDQGPGIPPQDRKRIFDMFVTTRPGGTGLGLFLARTAVENEGGTLVAQTPPSGRGACLRVTLPLEKKGPA